MVRVHINGELFAEATHLLPDRWNGWVVPVFNEEQVRFVKSEIIRLGWEEVEGDSLADWEDLGYGEWTTSGWCWEVEGK